MIDINNTMKAGNLLKKAVMVLCLMCLILTACTNTETQTEEITTTISEATETEKVSVASESTQTEVTSETVADSIIETIETTVESEEAPDEELDFWIPPTPKDGYIITDPANLLALKKLYPLICIARSYMMDSKSFSLSDENVYEAIEEYTAQEEEKYSEVFTWHLIDQIPTPNEKDVERGNYIYSLGYLSGSADEGYIYGNDRGIDATYVDSDWQIEVISDTEVQLIHQAFYSCYPEWVEGDEPTYFKDHKLLNQADDSVHQLRTVDNRSERLETYYYTLLWEDGHWKFDNFSLWQ